MEQAAMERSSSTASGLAWLAAPLLALVALAAHFLRSEQPALVAVCLVLPALLASRRRWAMRLVQLALVAGALVWLRTLLALARPRAMLGMPWSRLAIILGSVALLTAASALVFERRSVRARYSLVEGTVASVAAALLTALLLGVVQLQVPRPLLLLERFLPGGGWLEILALSVYAAIVVEKMLDVRSSAVWRRRVWALFSIVFFAQLAIGLLGVDRLLMSGKLHFPIPAMIIAGPLYRGGQLFMVVLFAVTVLLVGPAWCSHVCYIGAWDHAAARLRRKPRPLPRWTGLTRAGVVVVVIVVALLLRGLRVGSVAAGAGALVFGLLGVALMLFLSRHTGAMVHCLAFCPMGALAAWLGALSPFRLRIAPECDECGRCRLACRYDALNADDVHRRRPAQSCTLCGDCLATCPGRHLHYRCLGLRPDRARAAFLLVVVVLHAASMGLARI
jgi:ferredoxin